MQATERPEFTPPTEGGLTRSIGLALLAHAVLALGLSWGVKWKRDDPVVTAEAELWANAPQQAAPRPVEAPPAPPPPPPAPAQPQQPTQAERDAEIALEKERERKEAEAKARREEAERQKQLAERKRQEEARKEEARKEEARKEQARKADEKRKEELARTRKEQEDAKRLAQLREENMKRIAGMAGATGPRESTGTALRSSGPSASYAGRLAALFQRNVVFPGGVDTIAGNPTAVVQVRVSPTGEILSAKLSRSSGNPAWDEAAVRAIERSERIPADVDGRYVSDFPVEMKPKR